MHGFRRRKLQPVGFGLLLVGIALWGWVLFGGPILAGVVANVVWLVFIFVWITRPPDN